MSGITREETERIAKRAASSEVGAAMGMCFLGAVILYLILTVVPAKWPSAEAKTCNANGGEMAWVSPLGLACVRTVDTKETTP